MFKKEIFTDEYFEKRGNDMDFYNEILEVSEMSLIITASTSSTVAVNGINYPGSIVLNQNQVIIDLSYTIIA